MGKAAGSKHPGLYKRGRYWWITRDPVERRAISTRCTSLKAAQEWQIERERLGANPAYAAAQAARLGVACERYLQMRVRSGTKPVTVKFIAQKLGHWVRIYGSDAPLATFADVKVWDAYYRQRLDEGATNHTITKETQKLRLVLTSAKRAGEFFGDISALKPEGLTTSYKPRTRALTVEEVRLLIPRLSGPELALTCIALATGARLSEAQKLTPGDINLAESLVTIRGTKTDGSDRVVPILEPFRSLLMRAIPSVPVGVTNNLRRNLLAACKKAQIAPATMNDFRRSHASILAELGASIDHTKDLLGHHTTKMVERVYRMPRAQAIKTLIERSTGVVDITKTGTDSDSDAAAKCPKGNETEMFVSGETGFLSRRSHVQIVPGAPLPRLASTELSQACSRPLSLPLWALASAARDVGVLPGRRVA